jgi:hypothetical protein
MPIRPLAYIISSLTQYVRLKEPLRLGILHFAGIAILVRDITAKPVHALRFRFTLRASQSEAWHPLALLVRQILRFNQMVAFRALFIRLV